MTTESIGNIKCYLGERYVCTHIIRPEMTLDEFSAYIDLLKLFFDEMVFEWLEK